MIDNIKRLPKRPKTFEEYNKERITDETKLKEQNIRLQQIEAENEALRAKKDTEQLQILSAIPLQLEQLKTLQDDISKKVNELHTVQTGALYSGKKRLTAKEKKEKEEAEFQEKRRKVHQSWLNEK